MQTPRLKGEGCPKLEPRQPNSLEGGSSLWKVEWYFTNSLISRNLISFLNKPACYPIAALGEKGM